MQRLAALEMSAIPVWVLDGERMRIVWANQGAVDLWRADSREDLLARDLSGAPVSVRVRTAALLERVRASEVVVEEWTLYPKGVPTPVRLHLTGVELEDGRIGLLNQALPSDAAGPDPTTLRGIEAIRHVSVVVALVASDGKLLMQNPAALRAFGDRERWSDWFSNASVAEELLALAQAGEPADRSVELPTLEGPRLHAIHALAAKDPASGQAAVLVHQTDDTHRVRAQELQAMLAIVEQQKRDIVSLSAPVLDVGDETIAMPLIGTIDDERAQELTERLLVTLRDRKAEVVILDLTSAVLSDEGSATRLMQMLSAVRLLGARAVITGVQPALATHLVRIGFADQEIAIARSLAHGLARYRKSAR